MARSATLAAVWTALAGNLLVALVKFATAGMTASSAMLSEAVHSLVDTVNELLLLYGIRRAARPADRAHPLGYGREIYFWSFVVALLIFALGAGAACYEGIERLTNRRTIEHPRVIFLVLAASFVFESASWYVGMRAFRAANRRGSLWQAFRRSKDSPGFIVVFEDSAAILGLLVAAGGTTAALLSGDPRWDGIASLLIGAVLAGAGGLLAYESKELLIGERADPALSNGIIAIAAKIPGVCAANSIVTVQLGPNTVVATLSLDFFDYLRAPEIERACIELETRIRRAYPQVSAVFVKPQSVQTAAESSAVSGSSPPPDLLGDG
jgi:cation diffusion facilitator family transporter